MAISNVGSLVINLVVFLTTLVNFHSALAHVEPLLLVVLYIVSKLFARSPDDFCIGYVTPRDDHFHRSRSPFAPASGSASDHEKDAMGPMPLQAPNPEGLARMVSYVRKVHPGKKVGLLDRVCCYQWTWFTINMATGGIANVLHSIWVAYQASWIYYIGLCFMLFNLCLFLLNVVLISMRFHMVPGSFTHSFTDQVESLFVPAVVVACGIILINACEYGIPLSGPWLRRTMEALYWVYAASSMAASAGMYLILWSTQIFPVHMMTPVWVFPAYPLLLAAPFGSNLIASCIRSGDPEINYLSIAFCSIAIQGAGFLISFMICAAFIYRLMTQKLPRDMQRPGVFISIGFIGFTVNGIVLLGQHSAHIIPPGFQGGEHTVSILQVLSLMVGLWLWGLCFWFFLVSVGSLWKYVRPGHSMPFQMTWWSFVFPNTALVTATLALADNLKSSGLRIFGCTLAASLIIVWLAVFATMIRCLLQRRLLWPKEFAQA